MDRELTPTELAAHRTAPIERPRDAIRLRGKSLDGRLQIDMTGHVIPRSAAVVCGLLLGVPSLVSAAAPLRSAASAVQGISLSAQVSPGFLGLGRGFVDTATLTPSGGGPPPTGTISFGVYGPTDPGCAGPVIFNSTNTVSQQPTLSGAYVTPSSGLTPAKVGTYRIIVTYNGDASYRALATSCGDPANTVVVGLSPTLTALSPSSGPAGGGDPVRITGTNLDGAVTVNFGGVATPAQVLSSTEVITNAPSGSGTVSVTVTTEFGTTPAVAAGLYTYGNGIPASQASPSSPDVPSGVTPVTSGPQPPAVATGATRKITSSTARFTGTVGPSGVIGTAHFEYIVRLPGGRAITRRTPGQHVGLLGRRVTAAVSGLLAGRHYRVRLIVTSAAGIATAPATSFATRAVRR